MGASILKKFITLSFLFSLQGFAQMDCTRIDPWDPVKKMQEGPYEGECVATSSQRGVGFLSDQVKQELGLGEKDVLIANFKHVNTFWIAWLHDVKVKKVFIEEQNINGFEAFKHVRMRFVLDKPIRLIWQQLNGVYNPEELKDAIFRERYLETDTLYFSIESGRTLSTQNQAWNPTADASSFPIVARVFSEQALNAEPGQGALFRSHELDLGPLMLEPEEVDEYLNAVLKASLKYSAEKSFSMIYHVALRNCANETLKILDSVFSSRYPEEANMIIGNGGGRYLDAVPNLIGERLRVRGLLGSLETPIK